MRPAITRDHNFWRMRCRRRLELVPEEAREVAAALKLLARLQRRLVVHEVVEPHRLLREVGRVHLHRHADNSGQ